MDNTKKIDSTNTPDFFSKEIDGYYKKRS